MREAAEMKEDANSAKLRFEDKLKELESRELSLEKVESDLEDKANQLISSIQVSPLFADCFQCGHLDG